MTSQEIPVIPPSVRMHTFYVRDVWMVVKMTDRSDRGISQCTVYPNGNSLCHVRSMGSYLYAEPRGKKIVQASRNLG